MQTPPLPPLDESKLFNLLHTLVATRSDNPFRTVTGPHGEVGIGNEAAIQLLLERELKARGFSVERQLVQEKATVSQAGRNIDIAERFNVLGTKGTGEKSLLLFAHVDTVDVKAGWKHDAFTLTECTIEGRKAFTALGANDMKAGIAAILAAGELEPPAGWQIKVAFLVDEEFWSFGACTLLASDFLKGVKLAIVPELSEAGSSAEIQWIGIGRLGRTEFVFDIEGQACHGADAFVDTTAVNAAHETAKLAVALTEYAQSVKCVFEKEGTSAVNSAYLNYLEAGRGILSVPDRGSCVLDRSLVPGETSDDERVRIEAFVKKLRAEGRIDPRAKLTVSQRPRPTPVCKPYFLSPSSAAVRYVAAIAEEVAGQVELGIGRTVADENRLAETGIPVVILPPHGGGAHTPEEWVDAASIVRIAEILRQTVVGLHRFG